MSNKITTCVFCKIKTLTRQHHLTPRSKGGEETVSCCETCEGYIHSSWTHIQLRDVYNNVETILSDKGFQKFLKWRQKQSATVLFKSSRRKYRDKNPYH